MPSFSLVKTRWGYLRLRRSAKDPGMGCGEVGGATERYKARAAAAGIRCGQECRRKVTAVLRPDKPAPEIATATSARSLDGILDA